MYSDQSLSLVGKGDTPFVTIILLTFTTRPRVGLNPLIMYYIIATSDFTVWGRLDMIHVLHLSFRLLVLFTIPNRHLKILLRMLTYNLK